MELKYSDFIYGNEGFQYSVNIQYDLYNASKIDGYIPTQKSIELIQEYLLNTKNRNGSKATVLIGPYGKGKSHLLLVILSILSGMHKEQVSSLVSKIRKVDETCAKLIEDSVNSKKFLPIVLNSNSMDLNQSFLISLRQALSKIEANHILPNTFYDAAIQVIEGWKAYSATFERVQQLVKEQCRVSVEDFIKSLKRFDSTAYGIFKEIFIEVTAGVEFNPLINSDIVKLYEEVNHILKDKYGYSGMIIVFDEFSKFIEASASYNTSRDLKILQDFAELANRSDNPQIHLMCVTHKTINEYITQIPQNKVDAWRAIEGRFKEVYFNTSAQQNYELISNAIVKDEVKFNDFWEEHQKDYSRYNNGAFMLFNHLYKDTEFQDIIIKGCFPLSPYSAYSLPKISEKVAQNERTLFTFLSKEDKHSLLDIIKGNKGEKELITVDNLYDYFEPLLKKEVFNDKINTIWVKTNTALNHVFEEREEKVVKALAIINIVNDYKVFAPTIDTIAKSIGYTKSELDDILKNLINEGVLMIRKSNSYVDFMPISGVDVESKINSMVEVKLKNIDISKVVGEIVDFKYILPRRYNDEFKMVRYFNRIFMTVEELVAYDNANLLLQNKNCDGVFINLLVESDTEREKILTWVRGILDSRICVLMPTENLDIKRAIVRYIVIKELLKDEELLKEDLAIETQLEVLLEDIIAYIITSIRRAFDVEGEKANLYVKDDKYSKLTKVRMSELASEICYEHYSNSPKINNELINKNKISAPILKGRNFIVNMILCKSIKEFKSEGNSVECTMFRTTLLNKGLINNQDTMAADLSPLFEEIQSFIINSEKEEKSFKELYENLLTNKKGIGMRRGILPIYIAYILSNYLNEAVIYVGGRKKKEVPLTTEIINNINDNPENYFIKIEKGTKEKNDYIAGMEELFKEYKSDRNSEGKYGDIVKAMQVWLQSLSKYAQSHKLDLKKCNELEQSIVKFRSSLVKFDINNRQFLFVDIPKMLMLDSLNECYMKVKEIKKYEENVDRFLKKLVIEKTSEIINPDYKGKLPSAIKTWILGLDDEKLNHLYDVTTNGILEILKSDLNNEDIIVAKLAYTLTGLALEDWNDHSLQDYIDELKRVKSTVESYEVTCDSDKQGQIRISLIDDDGDITEKTFDKAEITPFGSMLLNNIEGAMCEFGGSIDDNEKRNILIKILQKFI